MRWLLAPLELFLRLVTLPFLPLITWARYRRRHRKVTVTVELEPVRHRHRRA